MSHYRVFISKAGDFRESKKYEFIAEFANRELATRYVTYMFGKNRYRGKDIIIKEVDADDFNPQSGKVDGVVSSLGEELHVEDYKFS